LTKHGRLALLDLVSLEWKYEIIAKVANEFVQNVEVARPLIVVFSQFDETLAVTGISLDHFWRERVVFSRGLGDYSEPPRRELLRIIPNGLLRDSLVSLVLNHKTQTLEVSEIRP
jgi:hypothetical protein